MKWKECVLYAPVVLVGVLFIPLQLIASLLDQSWNQPWWYWFGVAGMFVCSIPFLILFLISETKKYHWISDKIEKWIEG